MNLYLIKRKIHKMFKTYVPTIPFTSEKSIPVIGLGTYKSDDHEKLAISIKEAVNCGYRLFDCAYQYSNEEVVAKILNEAIKESQEQLHRDDFFIITQLWCTFHSEEEAKRIVQEQLNNFNTNYIDLYLMHWPMGFAEKTNQLFPTDENGNLLVSDVHYLDTYKYMEDMVQEGKVKSIGVSNFNMEQLQDLLKNCRIKPVAHQFEVNPYMQNDEMVEFCMKNDIKVIAYAPLGSLDRPWRKSQDPIVLEDEYIKNLAKKYHKSPAQICLRWLLQRNLIVIPKSVTPERIRENLNVFEFKLTDEEMNEMKKLNKNFRCYSYQEAFPHKLYPFKREYKK